MKNQNIQETIFNSQYQLIKPIEEIQKNYNSRIHTENFIKPNTTTQNSPKLKFSTEKNLLKKNKQKITKINTPVKNKQLPDSPSIEQSISPFRILSVNFLDYLQEHKSPQKKLVDSSSSQGVSSMNTLPSREPKSFLSRIKSFQQKLSHQILLNFSSIKNQQKNAEQSPKSNCEVRFDEKISTESSIANPQIQIKLSQRKNSGKTSQNKLYNILNPLQNLKKKTPIQNNLIKNKFEEIRTPKTFTSADSLLIKQQMKKIQMRKNKTPTMIYQFPQISSPETPKHQKKKLNGSLQKIFDRKFSTSITLQKPTDLNQFLIIRQIGKGKFGEVYLGKHRLTGFIFAIKRISKQKIFEYKMQKQLTEQIKLQSFCDHPNIVQLYNFFHDRNYIYLLLEYLPDGTLFNRMHQNKRLTQKQISLIIKETTLAIKYLHEHNIAHRDIKPQNLVLSYGIVKLCDFGWSALVKISRKTYCGTFDYAPPQILQRKQYGVSVDLWCLGILTYQLFMRKVPFQHQERKISIKKIINVDNEPLIFPIQISKEAKDFIGSLLKKNPQQRPKPFKLLQHQFFRQLST